MCLIIGQKTVDIQLPEDANAIQLVEEIVSGYPDLERELLDEQKNLYQHVHIVINGRDIQFLEGGLGRVISPEYSINIFTAILGGTILHPDIEVFIGKMEIRGIKSKIGE